MFGLLHRCGLRYRDPDRNDRRGKRQPVALIEIVVGAIAGNTIGLEITPWVNFLAGFGAILLTFLAGTEIDAQVIRKNLGASVGIGIASFLAPYLGVLFYAHSVIGWSWPQAQIAGISMSTTSQADLGYLGLSGSRSVALPSGPNTMSPH